MMYAGEAGTLFELAFNRRAAVEVGTWIGNSATVILDALADGGHLTMIDTFAGTSGGKGIEDMEQLVQLGVLFERLKAFPTKRATVAVTRSEWLAPVIADGSLDFVFIDGGHDLTSVARDLDLWTPKVMAGGIICGHDFEADADAFSPGYLVDRQHLDYDPASQTHPGVILAVTAAFGKVEHENRIWWHRL